MRRKILKAMDAKIKSVGYSRFRTGGSDILKAHQTMMTVAKGNRDMTKRAHIVTTARLVLGRHAPYSPGRSRVLDKSGQDDCHLGQSGKMGGHAGYGK